MNNVEQYEIKKNVLIMLKTTCELYLVFFKRVLPFCTLHCTFKE